MTLEGHLSTPDTEPLSVRGDDADAADGRRDRGGGPHYLAQLMCLDFPGRDLPFAQRIKIG
jgi:hypothetical protein